MQINMFLRGETLLFFELVLASKKKREEESSWDLKDSGRTSTLSLLNQVNSKERKKERTKKGEKMSETQIKES